MDAQQSVQVMWIYIAMGFCGILFHVYSKVMAEKGSNKGLSIGDFTSYVSANSLAMLMSLIVYAVLVTMWEMEGFDFFGWQKGVLNGSIIGVGYMGNSIMKSFIKSKTDKVEAEEGDKV
jgi:hypothetical protein